MRLHIGACLLLVLLLFAGPATAGLAIVDGDQTIAEGSTITFTVATMDGEAYTEIIPNTAVSWNSSDPQVGSVFADGTFGAAEGGNTIITAAYEGMTASVQVTVTSREETMDLLLISSEDAVIPNGTYMLFALSGLNETYGEEIFLTDGQYKELRTDGSDVGKWYFSDDPDDPDMPVMFEATAVGENTTTLYLGALSVTVNVTVSEPLWDVIWTEEEMEVDEYAVFSVPAIAGNESSGFADDEIVLNWTTEDLSLVEVLDPVNGTFRARAAGDVILTVAVKEAESETSASPVDVPVHIREVVLPTPIPEPTTDTSGDDGASESGSISPGGSVSFGTASGVQDVTVPEGMTGTITVKKESGAPAPSGTYYTVLDISSSDPLTGPATITFAVPIGILELEGLTTQDVALLHYENGGWTQLPTRYTGENRGLAEYAAETRSLSPFAIAFVPGGAAETAVTPIPTVRVTSEPTAVPTVVPTAAADPATILIQFAENVSAERQATVIAELKNSSGVAAVRESEPAPDLVPGLVLVRLPDGVTPEAAITFYSGFPDVVYAEKNRVLTIDSTALPTKTATTAAKPEQTKAAAPLAGLAAGLAAAAFLRRR